MPVMRLLKRLNEERSQAIIMFVAIFSLVTIMGAISIDFGLWLSERHGVERAADLAALAGSQSLLRHAGKTEPGADSKADNAAAISDACKWAARNGYQDGDLETHVEVDVQLFCRNTNQTFAQQGMCLHDDSYGSQPSPCDYGYQQQCTNASGHPIVLNEVGCDTISVTVKKPAIHLFTSNFGIPGSEVGFGSQAGEYVQAVPLDVVLALDDTGSMSGNPIAQTKTAATNFTKYLLSANNTLNQVGFTPFRGCYNPTRNINPLDESNTNPPTANWQLRGCVKLTDTISLSKNLTIINNGINLLQAPGGFPGTNVCLGLFRGGTILNGPGSQTGAKRALVILTDGDNAYTDYAQVDQPAPNSLPTANRHLANPPPNTYPSTINPTDPHGVNGSPTDGSDVCRPAGPNLNGTYPSSLYDTRINNLDKLTLTEADALKAQGVEIYVVGFGVAAGPDDGTPCVTSQVGTAANNIHRNASNDPRDRNLAKCIASSKLGTNDHYYEVTDAAKLGNIFQDVAWAITGRSLTQ
ncbi:MAG: VWA domain-containing protein [Dehalococcoidia bacterium]|jgi:hypothetical protein